LLALQKLKSEKEAAKRQMLLQDGGAPPTVREQREQELVSMNKQELAQQVGGAAQQQMAQQQQAMQRMMGGVGGQSVPAMMAEGGIVGYETGGDVEAPIPPEVRAQFAGYGFTDEQIREAMRPRGIGDFLRSVGSSARMGAELLNIPGKLWRKAGEYGPTISDMAGAVSAGYQGEAAPNMPGVFERARPYVEPTPEEQPSTAAPMAPTGIAALPQVQPAPAQAPAAAPRAESIAMDMPSEAEALAAMMPTAATSVATPETAPARESAGIGALAEQMQRLEAERGDKWGAVSDWMRGVAGAKDNSLGMSLAGGADALDTRNRDLEDRLSQLVDTQQKMSLAERAMGVDEQRAQTEVTEAELRRQMMQLEDALTREGWDREDARYASQNQSRVLQAALSQGLSGADAVRLYTGLMSNIPLGADPAQYADQAMRQTLEAMQLLGGTGGFNIVEELD
jgi:hypothetical protein